MPLLPYPYQTLRLSTPVDGATLHARLADIIQPEPPPGPPFSQGQRPPLLASRAQRLAWARLASGREHKPFWGRLDENGFEIVRVTHRRSLCHCVAQGRIRATGAATSVELMLRLPAALLFFGPFWCLAPSVGLTILFTLPPSPVPATLFALPLGWFLFSGGLLAGTFMVSARRALALLLPVLEPRSTRPR